MAVAKKGRLEFQGSYMGMNIAYVGKSHFRTKKREKKREGGGISLIDVGASLASPNYVNNRHCLCLSSLHSNLIKPQPFMHLPMHKGVILSPFHAFILY